MRLFSSHQISVMELCVLSLEVRMSLGFSQYSFCGLRYAFSKWGHETDSLKQ
jgi:hypothetical protein